KRALLAKLLHASATPASFGQQGLWVEAHLEPESTAYNIPIGLRITGPLRIDVLERSLSTIVDRHDSLRTTFELRGDELFQNVSSKARLPWTIHDLTTCAD